MQGKTHNSFLRTVTGAKMDLVLDLTGRRRWWSPQSESSLVFHGHWR
jgi:hypothetical protein